jgi:hypothetical protein
MELPTAVSGWFIKLAMKDTQNSGKVVATLTMVAPITILGTPVASAMLTAEPTNQLAPLVMIENPAKNRSIFTQRGKLSKNCSIEGFSLLILS